MKIELKEGESAPWGPIYPLSELELETLREWLKEMMRTGKIHRSTSPAGSPILFVSKPNGRGLRLCVDYRGINRVTIPNRYPLSLIQELQDRTQGAQFFTKMDLKNHVFHDMIDLGLLVYMDDLLVYAKTKPEHDELVRKVLHRLQANGLAVSAEKCVWGVTEVKFLGYIIGRDGIKMSAEKVEAVLEWKSPSSLTEVQSFLGFANFYRGFIQNYSQVARPLTELTKGSIKNWK
jgi:hypothetical protein